MAVSRRGKPVAFQLPASYRIAVRGAVSQDWSERLGGMQITTEGKDEPLTWLVGRLPDQAALMGVLETLHNLHLPLLNVEVMGEENGEWEAVEVAPEKDA